MKHQETARATQLSKQDSKLSKYSDPPLNRYMYSESVQMSSEIDYEEEQKVTKSTEPHLIDDTLHIFISGIDDQILDIDQVTGFEILEFRSRGEMDPEHSSKLSYKKNSSNTLDPMRIMERMIKSLNSSCEIVKLLNFDFSFNPQLLQDIIKSV